MPKRVFFSFHYQDVIDFRANVVRPKFRPKFGLSTVEKQGVDGHDFARNSGHRHYAF